MRFVATGDLALVQECVEENGANIGTSDRDGITPLQAAVFGDHFDIVRYFLDKGADIDIKNTKTGATALMSVSKVGDLAQAKYLIQNRASVEVKDDYGYTALMWASNRGEIEMVQYL